MYNNYNLLINQFMDEKTNIVSIDRKLSIVISLLMRIANNGSNPTLKDQIEELYSFGLKSTEIAGILSKKVSYISKELTGLKKKQK